MSVVEKIIQLVAQLQKAYYYDAEDEHRPCDLVKLLDEFKSIPVEDLWKYVNPINLPYWENIHKFCNEEDVTTVSICEFERFLGYIRMSKKMFDDYLDNVDYEILSDTAIGKLKDSKNPLVSVYVNEFGMINCEVVIGTQMDCIVFPYSFDFLNEEQIFLPYSIYPDIRFIGNREHHTYNSYSEIIAKITSQNRKKIAR